MEIGARLAGREAPSAERKRRNSFTGDFHLILPSRYGRVNDLVNG